MALESGGRGVQLESAFTIQTTAQSSPIAVFEGRITPGHRIRPFRSPIVGNALTYLVLPGKYTVRLEVQFTADEEPIIQEQEIDVHPDPTARPELDEAELRHELQLQHELSRQIWKTLDQVAGDINQIEFIRVQLEQLEVQLQLMREPVDNGILAMIQTFNDELVYQVEQHLYQMKLTGEGEDVARFPGQLVEQLVYLGAMVSIGDFRPTDQQLGGDGVNWGYQTLRKEADRLNKQLAELLASELPGLNDVLEQLGLPVLDPTTPPAPSVPCALFESGGGF